MSLIHNLVVSDTAVFVLGLEALYRYFLDQLIAPRVCHVFPVAFVTKNLPAVSNQHTEIELPR